MTTDNNNRFNTREELEVRKNELLTEIRSKSESIENIWHSLFSEKNTFLSTARHTYRTTNIIVGSLCLKTNVLLSSGSC